MDERKTCGELPGTNDLESAPEGSYLETASVGGDGIVPMSAVGEEQRSPCCPPLPRGTRNSTGKFGRMNGHAELWPSLGKDSTSISCLAMALDLGVKLSKPTAGGVMPTLAGCGLFWGRMTPNAAQLNQRNSGKYFI